MYWGLPGPIPILWMKETGDDYLFQSNGKIFIWDIVRDEMCRLTEPETLEGLLDHMNDPAQNQYRQILTSNPALTWKEVNQQGDHQQLPEHFDGR